MGYQAVFKRYELKYMVTADQKEKILKAMEPYMEPDRFGRSTVRNLYFDTDDFVLARHSIAKPDYKEKLRIRSYRQAKEEDAVFVELKKKYKSVVYKRRVNLPNGQAMEYLAGKRKAPIHTQITEEIDYFLSYYESLAPRVFLSYEREAYDTKESGEFRVTFDENILWRETELSLEKGIRRIAICLTLFLEGFLIWKMQQSLLFRSLYSA